MPRIRSRKLKTGTYWYFVYSDDREIPCGPGVDGEERAHLKLARALRNSYNARLGLETEPECLWTLKELQKADLEDARRRGLSTAGKPFAGRKPYRLWHWDTLTQFFGENALLDEITPERIRQFVSYREREVSAATINRDLSVLRSALTLAREADESGYRADPFRRMRPLRESHAEPIALSAKDLARVIAACWRRDAPLGAHIELVALTFSRLNDEPALAGGSLRFGPQKRGNPRSFRVTPRIRYLLKCERRFDYRLWRDVVAGLGMRDLKPHHIRHTALTLAAADPGASLLGLVAAGGWKSPAMASHYLHPGSGLLEPLNGKKQGTRKRGERRK